MPGTTVTEHIRLHFLGRLGVLHPPRPLHPAPLAELRETEWSAEFETLMRNRLLMGRWRYGRIGGAAKPQYDRIASMRKRLLLYEKEGNIETLVDIANLCLLEFVEGTHPNRHFHAVDDGEHVQTKEIPQ